MADPFDKALKDALAQPVGIGIICHGAKQADQLRRLLYDRRAKARAAGDPEPSTLSISFSPHAGDVLYIYKRKTDGQPPTDEEDDR